MHKSFKYLLLIFLLLITVVSTFAIYKTSNSGSSSVSAAKWVVKVITNLETTNIIGSSQNVNLGSCPKLAPGSKCEIPFTIDMTESEADSILTIDIGSNVSGASLQQIKDAKISFKISDGINEGYAYLLEFGTSKDLKLIIDWEAGDEDDNTKSLADVELSKIVDEIVLPVNIVVRQITSDIRTVTFNTHDSNIQTPGSIQVIDGGVIPNIPELSKDNYVFDGWYTSETGGIKLTNNTVIIKDTEYHARFKERITVTLTFNSDGGNNIDPEIIDEGSSLSQIPEPIRNGYTFLGWFDENDNKLTTSTILNTNKTYTAKWNRSFTTGQLVYFDPTSSETICEDKNSNNAETCMKWRVIDTGNDLNNDSLNLQLDHNLINNVAWMSEEDYNDDSNWGYGNLDKGPVTVLKSLAALTTNWNNVDPLTYSYDTSALSYNYGKLTCTNGTCTVKNNTINNVKARIISIEEIVKIVKTQPDVGSAASNWTLTHQDRFYFSRNDTIIGTGTSETGNQSSEGNTNLKWLIENTTNNTASGATVNTYDSSTIGYITLTPYTPYHSDIYRIYYAGNVTTGGVSGTLYGARPVINVLKTKLK